MAVSKRKPLHISEVLQSHALRQPFSVAMVLQGELPWHPGDDVSEELLDEAHNRSFEMLGLPKHLLENLAWTSNLLARKFPLAVGAYEWPEAVAEECRQLGVGLPNRHEAAWMVVLQAGWLASVVYEQVTGT